MNPIDVYVHGVRIDSATGSILDATPVVLTQDTSLVVPRGLACNGDHYVLETNDRLLRVGTDGQPIDPIGLKSTQYPGTQLLSNGDTFLRATSGPPNGFQRMSSTALAFLDATPIALITETGAQSDEQYPAAIAFDGAQFFVAWQDTLEPSGHSLLRHFTLAGAPVEASAIPVAGYGYVFLKGTTNFLLSRSGSLAPWLRSAAGGPRRMDCDADSSFATTRRNGEVWVARAADADTLVDGVPMPAGSLVARFERLDERSYRPCAACGR